MGPPCTAFATLSKINRRKYPETYAKSRAIGLKLSLLTATLCEMQDSDGRYWFVENPARSELFELKEWQLVERQQTVFKAEFPQCMLGLTTPDTGEPILKLTWIWTNSETLAKPFQNITCNHSSHGSMVGSIQVNGKSMYRSKLAQVWPWPMCRMIVEGVKAIIRQSLSASSAPCRWSPGRSHVG